MVTLVANKPKHRDFKIPPLTPQTISTKLTNPKWMRFSFIEFCVRENGWTRGAELGVLDGRTIGHLLKTCRKLHMIGVDLWGPQPDNPGPEGYEHYDHEGHYIDTLCKCRPHRGRYQLIRGRTVEVAKSIPDGSLDFVFIDADHSYEGCKNDILAWRPKVKPGGWLMGHDINWPGVRKAVDELVPDYEIGPNVVWFAPINPQPNWCAWT